MHAIGRSAPFIVLLGAAGYLLALTLDFDYPRAPGRLGPDAWPQAILVLLVIACLAAAVGHLHAGLRTRREAGEGAAPLPPDGEPAGHAQEAPRYGLVAAGALLFLAYPPALTYLGFVVATFLLMALFMLVGQWRNPGGVLAVSLVGTLALFYLFRGVVYVSLPLGVGPFQAATLWVARLLGMH